MARPKALNEQDIERGARLLRLRERRGLLQSELAAKAGLHPTEVSRVETGTARFQSRRIQRALAQAFECTVGELVDYVLGEGPAPGERTAQRAALASLDEDIDAVLKAPDKGAYADRVARVMGGAAPSAQRVTNPPSENLLSVLETAMELGLRFEPEVVEAAQLLAGDAAPKVSSTEWAAALNELAARRKALTTVWPMAGARPQLKSRRSAKA